MKIPIYLLSIIALASCTYNKKIDDCKGKILDLELTSFGDTNNKLFHYHRTNSFTEIKDTSELLRFEDSTQIAHFFQPSSLDSTKRKITYKVKEGIIKMGEYTWDLIV